MCWCDNDVLCYNDKNILDGIKVYYYDNKSGYCYDIMTQLVLNIYAISAEFELYPGNKGDILALYSL